MKVPERQGIRLLGSFVLLLGEFIDVADRRGARIRLGLQDHFKLIIEVSGRFIVQVILLFVLVFDDLDGFGPVVLK